LNLLTVSTKTGCDETFQKKSINLAESENVMPSFAVKPMLPITKITWQNHYFADRRFHVCEQLWGVLDETEKKE